MSKVAHTQRIAMTEHAARQIASMVRLEQSIELDPTIRELVKLRASQINGCAYCLDMHWKDARAAGETEERLYMLDAWRESPLYSDRERAALELCESVTLISETHVPDDVWEQAAAEFEPDELAQLVVQIAAINLWNRLSITARTTPGTYQPQAH